MKKPKRVKLRKRSLYPFANVIETRPAFKENTKYYSLLKKSPLIKKSEKMKIRRSMILRNNLLSKIGRHATKNHAELFRLALLNDSATLNRAFSVDVLAKLKDKKSFSLFVKKINDSKEDFIVRHKCASVLNELLKKKFLPEKILSELEKISKGRTLKAVFAQLALSKNSGEFDAISSNARKICFNTVTHSKDGIKSDWKTRFPS